MPSSLYTPLVLRNASQLSAVRSKATDIDMLGRYFDLLEETLTTYDLGHKPAQIYNVDESGMPLDPKPPKLIFQKGCQRATAFSSGNKKQLLLSQSTLRLPEVRIIRFIS